MAGAQLLTRLSATLSNELSGVYRAVNAIDGNLQTLAATVDATSSDQWLSVQVPSGSLIGNVDVYNRNDGELYAGCGKGDGARAGKRARMEHMLALVEEPPLRTPRLSKRPPMGPAGSASGGEAVGWYLSAHTQADEQGAPRCRT